MPSYSASNVLAQSSTLDVSIVEKNVPADLKLNRDVFQSMINFVEGEIEPRLPLDVARAVNAHPIRIVLDQDCARDAFFDARDPSAFTITMRPSVLQSEYFRTHLLAHEFFHGAHHAIHPSSEPRWLTEGMATTFENIVTGHFFSAYFLSAYKNITTPLMGEYFDDHGDPAQYGHDLQFFYYLYQQCGGESLFWNIARGTREKLGRDTIDAALALAPENAREQCANFESAATHFEIARIQNHVSFVEGRDPKMHLLYRLTLPDPPLKDSLELAEWRALSPWEPIVLKSDAPVAAQALKEGHHYWIQKGPPYDFRQNKPENADSGWVLLLFK